MKLWKKNKLNKLLKENNIFRQSIFIVEFWNCQRLFNFLLSLTLPMYDLEQTTFDIALMVNMI